MTFHLNARIGRADAASIHRALEQLGAEGPIEPTADGFTVKAKVEGSSARDLNRALLSALRKVERRTTIRAEWKSGSTIERYFDYALKKTTRA